MPTKIITGPSDPKNAEINQNDLTKITNDFVKMCAVGSPDTSRPFIKTTGISIPVRLMAELIKPYATIEASLSNPCVKIKFGITLPDQKDCDTGKIDVSNRLTVVAMIENHGIEMNTASEDGEDNYIITTGFKGFFKGGHLPGEDPCCPWEGGGS